MYKKLDLKIIIMILFFISGNAGLIYEIIWSELLTTLLGSSAVSVTIILTAFMGGLAIGSWVIGYKADKWSDKKIAIVYMTIEIIIGLYALSMPSIVKFAEDFYISLYSYLNIFLWNSILIKSFFSILMLILPTFMMGATLPLISRYLSRNWDNFTKNISLLYGLNTLGALFGSLLAGFYLLENYGISGATVFASCINFGVAILFLIFWKYLPSIQIREIVEKKQQKKNIKEKIIKQDKDFTYFLFSSYFLSGASSMFYQISWTRSLSLILGSSTYAFTTILVTFLLGIALGSMMYRKLPKNISKIKIYIYLQFFIILSVFVGSIFFDNLPLYYLYLYDSFFNSWEDLSYIRFFLASAIVFLPTLAMGILFPIVCDLVSMHSRQMSHIVGKTYAINSMGAMFGALLAGFLVIPSIGLQYTIYLGAFFNLVSALIVTSQLGTKINNRVLISVISIVVYFSFVFMTNRWSPFAMSSGVYIYADNYCNVAKRYQEAARKNDDIKMLSKLDIWEIAMQNYQLLYYKDGRIDTVSVMKNNDGIISLMVNGKVDASAKGEIDVSTQIMIAQLPLLLHKEPKNIFLVGYASGITAGNILTHDIDRVDVAEISPSVVEASKVFKKYNNDAYNDERLNLQIRDARHMLMVSQRKYDVIISQPSNPWIKGQSTLFSYEWYKIVKEHLENDGIFMQWLPAYHINERNLKTIIYTLNSVFPNVTLWSSGSPGDLIMIATKDNNFKVSYQNVLKRANNPKVIKQLEKIGLNKETFLEDLFLKNNKEVKKYINSRLEKPLKLNKDDLLITEYSTPKNMVNNKLIELFSDSSNLHGKKESMREFLEY